ncbi:MAG: phage portal protein [Glaciecola sp.]
MWPFSKKISQNIPSVPSQVAMAVKSVTLPEAQPDWKLFAKKDKLWDNDVAILEGYNASAVVYTCVEKRATLTSSVPWYAGVKQADGTIERLPDTHPANMLIENPNPDCSWLEVMHQWSQQLDLSGNGYASIIRAGARNEPYQIWNLSPKYIKAKPGRERLVEYYEYQEYSGTRRRIDASDMIQLRLPNPNDPIFGMPVLMAAGRATDIDRESGNWQKSSLQNRSAGSLHIEVPPETQPDQVAAIQKAAQEKYSGSHNADKPFVTSGKVNQLNRTAQEMDFVNSRKAIWAEICAVFGLSMSDLGFTESVNLANAEAMAKQLWKNTIIPRLELMKRQLNAQLAYDFGQNVCFEYDVSKVDALQENLTEQLANAEKLWRMGFSLEAINEKLGLGFDTDQLPEEIDLGISADSEPTDDEEVKRLMKAVGYGK